MVLGREEGVVLGTEERGGVREGEGVVLGREEGVVLGTEERGGVRDRREGWC